MKKILLLTAALLTIAACTKDEVRNSVISQPETLQVILEDESRIQLDEECRTVWTTDDRVSVFYYSDANDCWLFDGQTGDRTGNLHREIQGTETVKTDKVVIVYPYNGEYSISTDENRIYTAIPATQTYEKGSYGIGTNIMVSSGTDNSFTLKSVCGWLKLQLTGSGSVRKITLRGNSEEQLAGKAVINYDIPSISLIGDRSGDIGDSEVGGTLVFDDEYITETVLDCGTAGVALDIEKPTEFYFALVPQTFSSGVSVTVEMGNGKTFDKSTDNAVSIERNHILPMGNIETYSKITNAEDFIEFVNVVNSGSYNRFVNSFGEIVLANDIDLSGVEIPQITGLNGAGFADVFNGQGFALKNISVPVALIATNAGTIKNLVLESCAIRNFVGTNTGTVENVTINAGSMSDSFVADNAANAVVTNVVMNGNCDIEFAAPAAAWNFGCIVGSNAGTVSNCSSAAVYTKTIASLPSGSCNFGGIVGLTTGLVTDCEFTGKLEMRIEAPTKSMFNTFGGVVGYVEGSKDKIMVQNCKNSGSVVVNYKTACYFYTGGVVGGTASTKKAVGNYGIIDNCENTGNVGMIYDEGGSGAYPVCGGVCGYVEGYIRNCTNRGDVSLELKHSTNLWTCIKQGGVAGIVSRGADNCHNYGTLTAVSGQFAGGTAGAKGAGNTSWACWAGVIAAAGPADADNSIVFKNCTNNTAIDLSLGTITGTPQFAVGGVFGTLTGSAENCVNNKDIALVTPCFIPRVGGVVAATDGNITSCNNLGNIKVDDSGALTSGDAAKKRHCALVGGICGTGCTTKTSYTIKDCKNSGSIELIGGMEDSTNTTYIGGVYGGDAYNVINTVTITECTNSGTITAPAYDNIKTGNIQGKDADL